MSWEQSESQDTRKLGNVLIAGGLTFVGIGVAAIGAEVFVESIVGVPEDMQVLLLSFGGSTAVPGVIACAAGVVLNRVR